MSKPGLSRTFILALALVSLPILAGCGSNPFNPPIDPGGGLPPNTPLNDTPQNTMLRFEATYENQVIAKYEELFTSDFRFTFSSQTDDSLVTRYGNNWGKDDEIESTSHLFTGFTNDAGEFQAPASSITLAFDGPSFIDDPTRPDSAAFYKYVVGGVVNLHIALSNSQEFDISAPHDFYLVRGDVALLDPVQEARADRWYIYRWDDKSVSLARTPGLASFDAGSTPRRTTWGSLKSSYVTTTP